MHPSCPAPALFDANSSLEAFSDMITSYTHSHAPEPRAMHLSYMHMRGTPQLHACTCAPMTRMLPVHCAPDDMN